MNEINSIDTTFDVRTDAGNGDPDTTSATLRRYHQLLWSKPLPNGKPFTLETTRKNAYLFHESELGRFFLGSDTAVPTFRSYVRMAPILEQIPDEALDEFQYLNHTIGGMMVLPGERRPGTQTINGARGFNGQISDRLDLTIEAVRRHYSGEANPLSKTLTAYDDFFQLFGSFKGFVEFFLLHDLIDETQDTVTVFARFDDFGSPSALPKTVDEYREYRDNAMAFLKARNQRIDTWARENLTS